MAVTSANLKYNTHGAKSADGKRSWTSIYLVQTDSIDDHAPTVLEYSGLPDYGDSFSVGNSTDDSAYVVNKKADLVNQQEARKVWDVTVEYSTNDTKNESPSDNPEDDTPQVEWGFTSLQRALDYDFLGLEFSIRPERFHGGWYEDATLQDKATNDQGVARQRKSRAVVNTAGDPFDPPLMRDVWVQTLTITRNEAFGFFQNGVNLRRYQGSINAADYFGRAIYQVLCAGTSAVKKWRGQVPYYRVTYEFHLHLGDEIWYEPILNVGFNYIDADDSEGGGDAFKRRLIKLDKENADVPQLLNVDGDTIPDGADREKKAVYVPVWPYRAEFFQVLDLERFL